MRVKLLTEHHLEFLSLKGGSTGSSESTLVKMPHRWKSHVAAHLLLCFNLQMNARIQKGPSGEGVGSDKVHRTDLTYSKDAQPQYE